MSSQPLPVDSDPASPDWQHLEDLLDQIAQLSKSTATEHDFYRLLLERLVPAVGASGGAIWTSRPGGELALEFQIQLAPGRSSALREVLACHQRLVENVFADGQPRIAPPCGAESPNAGGDAIDAWVVCHPFQAGFGRSGVLELVDRRALAPADARGHARLLAAVVELADDFHRNRELGELRHHQRQWREFDLFTQRVHRSLDVEQTAFAIANDARRIVVCDRVSVLISHGAKCQAVAVSGVDTLDRRAKVVQLLEGLTGRAIATRDPLWYFEGAADVPDQLAGPLESYLDESHARTLIIVPLVEPRADADERPPRVLGALVAEQFQDGGSSTEMRERAGAVAAHAAVALDNALTHTRLPLSSLGRLLARLRPWREPWQLSKLALALTGLAAAMACLVLVPADFNIEARGELQPERRRDVFASDDGVVNKLAVDHGQNVRAGEALVVIRNPVIDLELSRVVGEIRTAEKKLAAVQAERLENAPAGAATRRSPHQLTADEEELKELLRGLQAERVVIEQQQSDLVVRSPLDGQALTWNLKKLLDSRPVARGQALMTVGDLVGPWVLELHLPDYRAGHVLAARDEIEPGLEVEFALAADPGKTYTGQIIDVALATELDEATSPTVLVTVGFDRATVTGLRPGATVIAQIHCGRRAVGYVWLHDLFEFVQSHWWW